MRMFIVGVLLMLSPTATFAQSLNPPPNTIDCSQFQQFGDGWTEVGTATFDLGSAKQASLSNQPITPNAINIGGYDLYSVLQQKCGSN